MMQTKRKQMFLQLYDHTGFERRLEQLALKGWKLEKCGTFLGWKFRKIEPTALRYKVVYFPEASEYDPQPGDKQAEFMELCEQSGWEYIDHAAQMLIFCTKYPFATPIETDAMMQVETVHKAMKKNYLPGQIGLLVLSIFQLVLFGYRLKHEFMYAIMYDGLLVSYFAYFIMALLCVHHLAGYFLWRRKALAAAEDGIFVETKGSNVIERLSLLALFGVLGIWLVSISDDVYLSRVALMTFVAIVAVIAIANGAKLLMQKLGIEAGTNRIATTFLIFGGMIVALFAVVFGGIWPSYDDSLQETDYLTTYEYVGITHYVYDYPIPLTLEMLGIEADYEYRSRFQDVTESMLITVYNGQELAPWGTPVKDPPEIYYTLTIPRFKGMIERIAEEVMDDNRIHGLYGEFVSIDAAPWGAEEAYVSVDENGVETCYYTLIYPNRIVEIKLPCVPTAEQIGIITDALCEYEP